MTECHFKVSSDGAYVASGSRDAAVYVWNAESARGGEVRCISYSV